MPLVSVHAPAPDSHYSIVIERGLLARSAAHFAPYAGLRAVVVSDAHVAPLYGDALLAQLAQAGVCAQMTVLPAGETTKCPEQLSHLYDTFLAAGITRGDLIIALGGGVIGDLAGYAACTFLRGVPFIQIPTTLLAQVDSSVGGKVAVNHPLGKNLLGAFYQPQLVLIDPDTLLTLPDRELGAGLGEVIKYGCIADAALFSQLESLCSREALRDALPDVIARCCAIKARYVQADPHDHSVRMELNFGHTLAHAIENGMGYGTVLHGEAVCIGMAQATAWGERLAITPTGIADRLLALLRAYRLPTQLPDGLSPKALSATMALDKKAIGSQIRVLLLSEIGTCRVVPLTAAQLGELIADCASSKGETHE